MTQERRQARSPRAFSLIEVLMAIFILGIGAISIAALFPAGIAQQRQSADDVMGPIVANNAIEVLRTKLRQRDFGDFQQWGIPYGNGDSWFETIDGDWGWVRPTHIFEAGSDEGAIDVFSYDIYAGDDTNRSWEFAANGSYPNSSPALYGVPYNLALYPGAAGDADGPPRLLFTRGERYYPQHSSRPQYVWDCMFKKFQGKVLVTIFVYRATVPGGEQAEYAVAPEGNTNLSPLPFRPPSFGWPGNEDDAWDPAGADGVRGNADDAIVAGAPCDEFLPFERVTAWQESGQWILDQNNNVHRVLSAYCDDDAADDVPRIVELVRPVPDMPFVGPFYLLDTSGNNIPKGTENVVSDIWFMPLIDDNGVRLTPVYLTVKEL